MTASGQRSSASTSTSFMYLPVSVVKGRPSWNRVCCRTTPATVSGSASATVSHPSAYMCSSATKHMASKMSRAATAWPRSTLRFSAFLRHWSICRGEIVRSQASHVWRNSVKAGRKLGGRRFSSCCDRQAGEPRSTFSGDDASDSSLWHSRSTFSGISKGAGRPSRRLARLQAFTRCLDSKAKTAMHRVQFSESSARDRTPLGSRGSRAFITLSTLSMADARPGAARGLVVRMALLARW